MSKSNLPEVKAPANLTPGESYILSLLKEQGKVVESLVSGQKEIKKSLSQHSRSLKDIEEEYPLDPCMSDDIQKAVKRKGVEVLGGKKSNAYQDKSLRIRVYQDIYSELKREFGLLDENGYQVSYKHLKKKYFNGALIFIDSYQPSMAIENEIMMANEIEDDEE